MFARGVRRRATQKGFLKIRLRVPYTFFRLSLLVPAHMNSCIGLALAPRLVHGFLDGRKQILKNRTAAKIDFSRNLHSRA